jgi:RND family efflux transporter MFP subunit
LEPALGHKREAWVTRTRAIRYSSQGIEKLSKSLTALLLIAAASPLLFSSCSGSKAQVGGGSQSETVAVTPVRRLPMSQKLTVSSELVPFQEIDVYAKESGFVKQLLVDYGTHVRAGQLLAVLEIPELEAQVEEDQAAIVAQQQEVTRATHDVERDQAQHNVLHLQYTRIAGVAKEQPGLVAQQEVDDAQGKDIASESQIEAAQGALDAAKGQLVMAGAKLTRDQALFAYARITAPFNGVVTQRYANLGALMQAGTNSSTQSMPLVKLSEDDLFRLVIPVPESYASNIRIGDTVNVNVTSLNRAFPGRVARFSVDVQQDTRTMHTEVDVPNPGRVLMPGMYAEATIAVATKTNSLAVPLEAVDRSGDSATVDVLGPSNKIEVRAVKLGIQTPSDAEVLSGLQEGEMVVISDRSGLKAGQEARPKVSQSPKYQEQEEHN